MKKAFFILFVFLFLTGCKKNKLNHLANETSPYLIQHAANPVNWYPWSAETLSLAKKENKLMLISIGYSSCHWCHVMEEESFSDKEIANFMNKNFINIKVDREERPDVDKVYLKAVELIANKSGWPLNCVTLPNGKPFWGGTYFTKEEWLKNLKLIVKLHKEEPSKITKYAEMVTENIQPSSRLFKSSENSTLNLKKLVDNWVKKLDYINGGDLQVPKFPKAINYQFLLRYAQQQKNDSLRLLVNRTLTKMALGGIFDHVDGGFSRYSTDKKWHVPHFEKMLYDNAQLIELYSEAYQATKNSLYKEVVFNTLSFVESKLYNKDEGFFKSTISAQSLNLEGVDEEGAYYYWKKEELQELKLKNYKLFSNYFNINDYGLWKEDKYVLIRKEDDNKFLEKNNITKDSLKVLKESWKQKLQQRRVKKVFPNVDNKVLTSWNALMLNAFIKAYKAFGEEKIKNVALKNARFISENLVSSKGKLLHSLPGNNKIDGYLDDYANLIRAYISLYEITFNEHWVFEAKKINDYVINHFYDKESSLFYYNEKDKHSLVENIDVIDGDVPSGNSVMANNLFLLSKILGDKNYKSKSAHMLKSVKGVIKSNPSFYANWLQLYLNETNSFYEVAVLGKNTLEISKELNKDYSPNKILVGSLKANNDIFLLKNKYVKGKNLIYVCVDNSCKYPTSDINVAREQMELE